MTQYKLPTKNDLRVVPKNKTIESTVVSVEIKTWRELITDPKILDKFKEEDRDTPQVIVKYDYAEGTVNYGDFRCFCDELIRKIAKLQKNLKRS